MILFLPVLNWVSFIIMWSFCCFVLVCCFFLSIIDSLFISFLFLVGFRKRNQPHILQWLSQVLPLRSVAVRGPASCDRPLRAWPRIKTYPVPFWSRAASARQSSQPPSLNAPKCSELSSYFFRPTLLLFPPFNLYLFLFFSLDTIFFLCFILRCFHFRLSKLLPPCDCLATTGKQQTKFGICFFYSSYALNKPEQSCSYSFSSPSSQWNTEKKVSLKQTDKKKANKKEQKKTQMDYIFMPKVHLPAKKKWLKIFVCLRQLRVSIIVIFFTQQKNKI